ncbi:MAG: phosphoribosyl-AMP cyclohydrolase [Thermoproteota archaeon]
MFKMSAGKAGRFVSKLSFKRGLIPVVVKDSGGMVLMVAFMSRRSLFKTLTTGFAHYYSRSRGRIWMKGEESGFRQRVLEVRVNCENNSLLFTVEQEGLGTCHMGYRTCFFRKLDAEGGVRKAERKTFDPEKVYADKLRKKNH